MRVRMAHPLNKEAQMSCGWTAGLKRSAARFNDEPQTRTAAVHATQWRHHHQLAETGGRLAQAIMHSRAP